MLDRTVTTLYDVSTALLARLNLLRTCKEEDVLLDAVLRLDLVGSNRMRTNNQATSSATALHCHNAVPGEGPR